MRRKYKPDPNYPGMISLELIDDENEMYIRANERPFTEIIEMAESHFGCNISELNIEAEHIHTSCLTYDCHDSSDWETYFIITRKK